MAKEKPYYRETIAELRNLFGKELIRSAEICKIMGMTHNQARARFSLDKGGYIFIEQMARDIINGRSETK